MERRYGLLLILLLLLTGCTFEYNVEITKNTVKEDNIIFLPGVSQDSIERSVNNLVNKYTGPTNSLGLYQSSVINRNNTFGMSYQKNYTISEYNDYSLSFSQCYDLYKMIKDNNKVIIATSKEFKCFDKYEELDSVTINLTTDLEVESSTADSVHKNKYTWNINRQNYRDSEINIVLNIDNDFSEKINPSINPAVLVAGVFLLLIIIILVLRVIAKKKNKV